MMTRMLLLLLLLSVTQPSMSFSYMIEITEKELQENLATMMPLEKTKMFIKVTLTHPMVELLEGDDRINFSSNIHVLLPGSIKG
ncbi:MAG: hypothetical protein OEZ58_20555, partial [Gammaproteobacteria bacterium]|nr:hypothetical protein [Gammaproteobacteria bacterium]